LCYLEKSNYIYPFLKKITKLCAKFKNLCYNLNDLSGMGGDDENKGTHRKSGKKVNLTLIKEKGYV